LRKSTLSFPFVAQSVEVTFGLALFHTKSGHVLFPLRLEPDLDQAADGFNRGVQVLTRLRALITTDRPKI
jgi:hypothetical protein